MSSHQCVYTFLSSGNVLVMHAVVIVTCAHNYGCVYQQLLWTGSFPIAPLPAECIGTCWGTVVLTYPLGWTGRCHTHNIFQFTGLVGKATTIVKTAIWHAESHTIFYFTTEAIPAPYGCTRVNCMENIMTWNAIITHQTVSNYNADTQWHEYKGN